MLAHGNRQRKTGRFYRKRSMQHINAVVRIFPYGLIRLPLLI